MIFKIALRNTLRQKRRTVLTLLTMFGGFVLSAISIGWSDGTYNNIIDMFTRNRLGHIQVHGKGYLDKPSIYNSIKRYEQIGQAIQGLAGVETWTPRLYSAGLASVGDNSAAVQIIGIDPEREQRATRFNQKIISGKAFGGRAEHGVILGKSLAEVLKATVDDELIMVSQAADGSIANDLYRIVGIIQSGEETSDRMSVYMHLADAQALFVLPSQVHEIAVIAKNLHSIDRLTRTIRERLHAPGLSVEPWQEFARSFYHAMKADLEGMWIMIFVIVLIVSIGVLNTVLMSVLERTREYGMAKAVGTRPSQIFWQVVCEVNLITLASIVLGICVSMLINRFLSVHGVTIPTPFTYGGVTFDKMYSAVNARTLYLPGLSVFLSASLVSVFPALRAAHIRPAKAMRIH
ncbi:ABC transporter permease [bacterium]|nr:ABC transporter permease [bacterium]